MSEAAKPTSVPHAHAWRMQAHIDSCHGYTSVYVCECGATRETYGERSPEGYGMVWMMDDDGSPMCERCEALINGAEPEHRDEIRVGVA